MKKEDRVRTPFVKNSEKHNIQTGKINDHDSDDIKIYALAAAVGAVAIWLFFHNLGLAELGKAEGRIAEVVREMLIKKDYLHPTCLWVPYVTKPLIPYWLIIGVERLTGELNELTLRIPSAVGGLVAVTATWLLGTMIYDKKAGLLGAVVLVTSFGILQWGRCAAPDMLNVAFIMVSVSWYWYWRNRPTWWAVFIFGVLTALSGHMKGMVGVVIPLMVAGIDIFMAKRIRRILMPDVFIPLIAGLLLYFVPFLLSSSAGGTAKGYHWLAMAVHESITRAVKPFDHKGSPFMYFEFVPIWMLPWTPLFIGMLYLLVRHLPGQSQETKWLLASCVAIFAMFTFAGSRRSYYILPILPFCAVISGAAVEQSWRGSRGVTLVLKGQVWLFLLLSLGLLGFGIFGLFIYERIFPLSFLLGLLVHGGAMLLVSAFVYWGMFKKFQITPELRTLSVAFVAVAFMVSLLAFEKTYFDKRGTEQRFAKEVLALLTNKQHLVPLYYRLGTRQRARLSFYLKRPTPIKNFLKAADVYSAFIPGKQFLILVARENAPELMKFSKKFPELFLEPLFQEGSFPWEGWPNRQENEKEGKLLCLTLGSRHSREAIP